jgi:RNA polymerase sigma factor (TIGR02999 family)
MRFSAVSNSPPSQSADLATSADGERLVALRPEFSQSLFEAIRRIAGRELRKEQKNVSLRPTELANEAWLVLHRQGNLKPSDRSRYLAAAARTIRRVLVDHARKRKRLKRGGPDRRQLSLVCGETGHYGVHSQSVDVLVLEEVLERLTARDSQAATVVVMRFYGGLKNQEIAADLGVSERLVVAKWTFARAWLLKELGD